MVDMKGQHTRQSDRGVSIVEVVVVLAIASILSAIAIPQMVAQRRLIRSAGINRQISTQLRFARQLAMSQREATPTGPLRRVAFTFQYDDVLKEIRIIGPIPAGTTALIDPDYPNNPGSRVVDKASLTEGGLPAAEIVYGIPDGTELPAGAPIIPTGALGDGVSMTALSNNKINITFQPDGTVIDAANSPLNRAMYFYNKTVAQDTASAISVLGASGRVKVWRYGSYANTFAE
jgi:prepilin-type N-terminal cleavage/methylation domain-containing protein